MTIQKCAGLGFLATIALFGATVAAAAQTASVVMCAATAAPALQAFLLCASLALLARRRILTLSLRSCHVMALTRAA